MYRKYFKKLINNHIHTLYFIKITSIQVYIYIYKNKKLNISKRILLITGHIFSNNKHIKTIAMMQ